MLIHTIYRLLHYCKVAKIFKKSQKCTPLNSFKKLIPHIMKVGGLYICFKMAWMIVPCVVMNFVENCFVQTQIS